MAKTVQLEWQTQNWVTVMKHVHNFSDSSFYFFVFKSVYMRAMSKGLITLCAVSLAKKIKM